MPSVLVSIRVDRSSDAENPLHVYEWRLEQEASLRQARGSGMTDAEVVDFVNGCLFAFTCVK